MIALLIVLILALLAFCLWPTARGFDYFRDKAEQLDRDPARVLSFVKDEVIDLPYRGDVKGPLGALWDGAASPEEKLALAKAILAHCRGGGDSVTLAQVSSASGELGAAYQVTVVHRAILSGEAKPRETTVYTGPIGALVGNVHSVARIKAGATEVALRGSAPGVAGSTVSVDVSGGEVVGEELALEFERPTGDGAERTTRRIVRELWRKGNRVGLDAAAVGDRHEFVVWPCRITTFVREKEELRLKEAGRLETVDGQAYLTLLDFALEADQELATVESKFSVRARFDLPRVLMLSRIEVDGQVATALDLRQDAVTFTGEPKVAWQAANARAWKEAALEDRFLREKLGVPVSSAWSLFQQLDDSAPNAPGRRLFRISRALSRVLTRDDVTQATFGVAGSEPRVVATRAPDGSLSLRGEPIEVTLASKFASADGVKIPYDSAGKLEAVYPKKALAAAAVAVEATILAAAGPVPTSPNYLLDTRLERRSQLVRPNAQFTFQTPGDRPRQHDVRVVSLEQGGLQLSYAVREGLSVVRGEKAIGRAALRGARRHNPWYRRGRSASDDATSFCLSRAVFADLKAGRKSRLALLARHDSASPLAGTRGTSWEGDLVPGKPGRVTLSVNGKPTPLATLAVGVGKRQIVLLDDPRFPIGLVDRLSAVQTAIRARVVDPQGVGFSGAIVHVGEEELTTDVDGFVLIPAPGEGQPAWGKAVKVRVERAVTTPDGPQKRSLGAVTLDLSRPGLDVVPIKLARRLVDVRLIAPDQAEQLEPLEISAQVKRHARRSLAAGRTIAIPARMVNTAFGTRIAYFAHDQASGNLIGVGEDGLHGASGNWEQLRNEIQQELVKRINDNRDELLKDGVHPIHMIRGFVVAFTVYATYRLRGMSHNQTVERMLKEMEQWEKATNLFTHVPDWVGETEAGGLVSKIGNANGPTSFYIGYLSALGFLHKELGR